MFTIIDNKRCIEVRHGYTTWNDVIAYSADYDGSPESRRDAIASAQMFANTAARTWKKGEPVEVIDVVHLKLK